MGGNKPFVYINGSEYNIEDTIDGTMDECWSYVLNIVPEGEIVAPLAEANGTWVGYYGTPEQVAAAYARIRSLDPKNHRWCGSFTIMGNTNAYVDAVLPYIDVLCPSHYDSAGAQTGFGGFTGAEVARNASAHGSRVGLPVVLAQTGTNKDTDGEKVQWLYDLLREADRLGNIEAVIYFNRNTDGNDYAFDWSLIP